MNQAKPTLCVLFDGAINPANQERLLSDAPVERADAALSTLSDFYHIVVLTTRPARDFPLMRTWIKVNLPAFHERCRPIPITNGLREAEAYIGIGFKSFDTPWPDLARSLMEARQ